MSSGSPRPKSFGAGLAKSAKASVTVFSRLMSVPPAAKKPLHWRANSTFRGNLIRLMFRDSLPLHPATFRGNLIRHVVRLATFRSNLVRLLSHRLRRILVVLTFVADLNGGTENTSEVTRGLSVLQMSTRTPGIT